MSRKWLSKQDELTESTSEKDCNKKTTQTDFDEVILTVLRYVEKVCKSAFNLTKKNLFVTAWLKF